MHSGNVLGNSNQFPASRPLYITLQLQRIITLRVCEVQVPPPARGTHWLHPYDKPLEASRYNDQTM